MGYAQAQYQIVPFLVLIRALYETIEKDVEVTQTNFNLINQTC